MPRANVQFENRILVPTLIPEIASNGCDDLRKSARALVMSWAIAYTGFTIWGLQHGRRRIFSISISVPSGSNEQNGHFGADCPAVFDKAFNFHGRAEACLEFWGLDLSWACSMRLRPIMSLRSRASPRGGATLPISSGTG